MSVMHSSDEVRETLALVFRDQWEQITRTLVRVTRDRELSQECAQDAFASALERWPRDGIPTNPGAWLTTAARNKAIDRLRRESRRLHTMREVALSVHDLAEQRHEGVDAEFIPDERLRLIFACCDPVLPAETGMAIALRIVGGLSPGAIARAFDVPEPTMSKRLMRAKQRLRRTGFRLVSPSSLGDRVDAVCGVLCMMFDVGPATKDASFEALQLMRTLVQVAPNELEPRRTLAAMEASMSRRGAGHLVDGLNNRRNARSAAGW